MLRTLVLVTGAVLLPSMASAATETLSPTPVTVHLPVTASTTTSQPLPRSLQPEWVSTINWVCVAGDFLGQNCGYQENFAPDFGTLVGNQDQFDLTTALTPIPQWWRWWPGTPSQYIPYNSASSDGNIWALNEGQTNGEAAVGVDFIAPSNVGSAMRVTVTGDYNWQGQACATACPFAATTAFGEAVLNVIDRTAGNTNVGSNSLQFYSYNEYCNCVNNAAGGNFQGMSVTVNAGSGLIVGHDYNLVLLLENGSDTVFSNDYNQQYAEALVNEFTVFFDETFSIEPTSGPGQGLIQ